MNEGMTDIKALREKAERATPGPWETNSADGSSEFGDYTVYGIKGVCDADWAGDGAPAFAYAEGLSQEDAEFIAAVNPQVVLALLNEIERLQEALEEAQRDAKVRVEALRTAADKFEKNPEWGDWQYDFEGWSVDPAELLREEADRIEREAGLK